MLGLHHLQKRKRAGETPNPKRGYRILDRVVYMAAAIGPIMTLPQIYTIWIEKQAGGVSTISWTTYAVLNIVWIAYGVVHKDRVIFFSSAIWLFINSSIAIGAMIY